MTIEYPPFALVILCAPSGSGKSTFAARHFAPSQIVSSDRCRAMIVDDAASQAVNDDAFALLHTWLEMRLKHRRFTVVDSTALKPSARDNYINLAQKHRAPCFVLALNVPVEECIRRDFLRADRQVGERVVRRHHAQFDNARREIARDDRLAGFHILDMHDMETAQIRRSLPASEAGRFDVIGDVHGCWPELCDLWEKLGYTWDERGLPVHPEGRIPVFVGDLADRGPDSPRVLRTVASLVAAGDALFAPGNHDDKLFRMLMGRNVTRTHGLDVTEKQIKALPYEEKKALVEDILSCLAATPTHLVLDGGRLVVAHAGIREEMIGKEGGRIKEFTLYGDVRGFEPGTNKPIRYDWASEYRGSALIVYGHTPAPEMKWVRDDAGNLRYVDLAFRNNTLNIDTGCVFGGALTALRYPERELVAVPAREVYYAHEDLTYSRRSEEE